MGPTSADTPIEPLSETESDMSDPTVPPAPEHEVDHLAGAAAEDEMLRLDEAHAHIANRRHKMRPIPVQAPPSEPELRTGDTA